MLTPRRLRSDHAVSLWTRVVGVISFVLVAGTLATGGLSLYLLHRTLLGSIDNDLRTTIAQVKRVEPEDLAEDTGTPERKIAPIDFIVEFRGYDGTVTGRAVQSHGALPSSLSFPDLTRAQVAELQEEPFTLQDANQTRWRVMVVPDPEHDGMVFVALPMTSVDQTMHEMALIILLVGTAVVLAGMGIGGYVAHRALEPLRDVEATARQIAGGDLSRRVPVTGTSQEVQALAVSLNEMLVRIEQSFDAQSRSETRATASEARMRRFVGDASHELRTPLAAIRGFGELYRMGALRTDEDVTQAMRRIEDEARRMGSLVENLLRLARLDDNPEPVLVPVDISDAIFDAAQDLRALDPDRQVMVVSLSGTPLTVHPHVPIGVLADEPSLRQVILNLVGNANRHTPKGSPVELAAGLSRDGTVFVEVRDHGEGIPPDQRERVFERFYRTDVSRQRSAAQGGGAGLGLSIAATIVEQHQGRISIHQTPGGGATFRVELVAADIDAEHAVAPDQVRALTADGTAGASADDSGGTSASADPDPDTAG
ncbi:sensor histidine kinase [Brachybacterium sp. AOP25-B2-12]|uniref:sensor histidine kinase n=1 Tax=Brachybacterium sp. AOP25-B2-12 TaxID=3457710 RepID=UPI004033DABE